MWSESGRGKVRLSSKASQQKHVKRIDFCIPLTSVLKFIVRIHDSAVFELVRICLFFSLYTRMWFKPHDMPYIQNITFWPMYA